MALCSASSFGERAKLKETAARSGRDIWTLRGAGATGVTGPAPDQMKQTVTGCSHYNRPLCSVGGHLEHHRYISWTEYQTASACPFLRAVLHQPDPGILECMGKFENMDIPFYPTIALLSIYPKNTKIIIHKDLCTPIFMAAQFTIAKIWKQPKCPSTDGWIKKLWFIYTMEYYSAIKKNEILPFAMMWMYLEVIMLSEISQTEKDKCHVISLICGI
ncbi:Retrovirus-related Pol polyprotein LINE-1 [Pteropus alecto]|uniref:Retrovirus-related Pol polyprotein LINE-1 n=1 Tax=Pteropus alecto TaxID=9402 RepID=L5KWM4_PTEAL|nr:Retrovirus-related Pol polyprotein LINE-1 [Pteropus alecto]